MATANRKVADCYISDRVFNGVRTVTDSKRASRLTEAAKKVLAESKKQSGSK